MIFSISSFLISLAVAALLAIILQVILWQKKHLKVLRVNFIVGFFTIILLRLLIPVELPTTVTVRSEHLLPLLYNIFLHKVSLFGQEFQVLHGLLLLWLLGSLIYLVRLYQRHRRLKHSLAGVVTAVQLETITFLNEADYHYLLSHNIKILQSNAVFSAMTEGVRQPKIFISAHQELNSQELNFMVKHELQHIKNRDVFLKYFLDLMVAIYWWFPVIYLIRKQLNLIIELRVDAQVTKALTAEEYFPYVESLVSVVKKVSQAQVSKEKPYAVYFSRGSQNVLWQRITFLLDGYQIKRTNGWWLVSLGCVFIAATAIVFEPYDADSPKLDGTFEVSPDSSYILEESDGKYYLYVEDRLIGEVDFDLQLFEDIPIVTK